MKIVKRVLFLFIFLAVPFEKKIDKIFFPLSTSLKKKWGEFPYFFDQNLWFFAVDVALIAFLLGGLFSRVRKHSFVFHPSLYWLFAFVAITFLSLIASPSATYPLHYMRFFQLLLVASAFLYVARSNLFSASGFIEKLFWVICLVALFESSIAIAQHFIRGPIGLRVLGEMKHAEAYSQFSLILRGQGTFVHANHLGGFLVVSIAVTYYLFLRNSQKILLIFAFFMQTFGLFITFSRSAFLGWILMSSIWFFFSFRQKQKIKSLFFLFLGCNLIAFGMLFNKLIQRGGYIQPSLAQDPIRLIYQEIAWDMLQKHPLLGVGYNQFMIALSSYQEPLAQVGAYLVHNIYLLIGAETGFLGLFCFLGFLFSVIMTAWKYKYDLEIVTLGASFVALLWIGVCDFYPFYDQSMRVLLLLTAATLISRASLLHVSASEAPLITPILGSTGSKLSSEE